MKSFVFVRSFPPQKTQYIVEENFNASFEQCRKNGVSISLDVILDRITIFNLSIWPMFSLGFEFKRLKTEQKTGVVQKNLLLLYILIYLLSPYLRF